MFEYIIHFGVYVPSKENLPTFLGNQYLSTFLLFQLESRSARAVKIYILLSKKIRCIEVKLNSHKCFDFYERNNKIKSICRLGLLKKNLIAINEIYCCLFLF